MARSYYVKGRRLPSPSVRFELWLREGGYEAVSEMYPGAVRATALVYDYLQEFPERNAKLAVIEVHAKEIGWVSDYQQEEDDEEPLDIDPDEDWS